MKRSVAMMACVLSGALMIGSYSPVLAGRSEGRFRKSAEQNYRKKRQKQTNHHRKVPKQTILQKVMSWKWCLHSRVDTDSSMFHVNEANDGKGS